jgi:ribose-phosphate pyrophosphokinase
MNLKVIEMAEFQKKVLLFICFMVALSNNGFISQSLADEINKCTNSETIIKTSKDNKKSKQESTDLQIVVCRGAKTFVSNITNLNKANIYYTDVSNFEDGELLVKIKDETVITGKKVLIIQSISGDTNDALMELIFTMNIVHSLGAKEIYILITYLGYSRQDRVEKVSDAFSGKIVADLLSQPYINKIFLVKLHSSQIQGFFNIPCININTDEFFIEDIKQKYKVSDIVLVAPDVGAAKSIIKISKIMDNADFCIAMKYRPEAGKNEILAITGNNVKDKICIIVDDMVDSAGTLCNVAEKLREQGAQKVVAYTTHPVFSKKAIGRIKDSVMRELIISDTIDSKDKIASCDKVKIISIADWCMQKVLWHLEPVFKH